MSDNLEYLWIPGWAYRQFEDALYQGLMNNLYDNNPGEIDRWADDGGLVRDDF